MTSTLLSVSLQDFFHQFLYQVKNMFISVTIGLSNSYACLSKHMNSCNSYSLSIQYVFYHKRNSLNSCKYLVLSVAFQRRCTSTQMQKEQALWVCLLYVWFIFYLYRVYEKQECECYRATSIKRWGRCFLQCICEINTSLEPKRLALDLFCFPFFKAIQ